MSYDIIDPWTLTPQNLIDSITCMPFGERKKNEWVKLNKLIGANNIKGIYDSSGLFAVLDGVDVDSGTASEIGYAYALNKPIVGYRGDFRLSGDNEGSIINLQVEYFIHASGGSIITRIDNLKDELKKIFN